MHERNPEMSGKLANLMAHNEATASKYYLLSEKTKASVEDSQHLSRLIQAESTSAETEGAESESSNNNRGDTRTLQLQRVPWKKSELEKITKIFEKEIEERNVSFPVVRAKTQSHVELNSMLPRRVYDKLKKYFLQDKLPLPVTSFGLPTECETLQDRIERMAVFPKWVNLTTYPLFP